jgi:imidazoleglycerol phosphate synthase glutamine amidotransferase subunit HisH
VGKPEKEDEMKLSNKTYDQAKFVAQILLPGVGTLYFAIAAIWGLPKADEVVGTITAVDAFLGLLLGLSSSSYNKDASNYDGEVFVEDRGDFKTLTLGLESHEDVDTIANKSQVTLKVTPIKSP